MSRSPSRIWSGVRVSASLQMFTLTAGRNVLGDGEGNCPRRLVPVSPIFCRGYSPGNISRGLSYVTVQYNRQIDDILFIEYATNAVQ